MIQPVGLTTAATQLGVGLALFYGVVKFFDTVGDKLNDDIRLRQSVRHLRLRGYYETIKNLRQSLGTLQEQGLDEVSIDPGAWHLETSLPQAARSRPRVRANGSGPVSVAGPH
jgi:hypothetical protein